MPQFWAWPFWAFFAPVCAHVLSIVLLLKIIFQDLAFVFPDFSPRFLCVSFIFLSNVAMVVGGIHLSRTLHREHLEVALPLMPNFIGAL